MSDLWGAVLTVLLGGGLLTALWNIRKDRRAEPIENRDAHIASANSLREMALSIADAADKRSERSEARVSATEIRIVELEAAHVSDSARIDALERRESRLVQYVRDLWLWIRNGSPPPPPAVPADLHDVLPPHEMGWHPLPPDTGQPTDPS